MAPCDRYRKLSKNLRHAPSAFCRQKSVVIDKMLKLDLPACGLDLSSVTSACTPITYATKKIEISISIQFKAVFSNLRVATPCVVT